MTGSSFLTGFNNFLSVPASDADDARRRKLLNIILVGIGSLSIAMMVIVLFLNLSRTPVIGEQDSLLAYASGIILLVGVVIFYSLNRSLRVPGWVASGTFLIFLLVLLGVTDSPQELADGRSLFVFAIPIIMSSMLLRPALSFVFSILVSIELVVLAEFGNVDPNTFAMATFILLALVSWLSARSLEQALKELRQTNRELDRRVEDRTRELSAALARELAEASKNQAILEGIADGVVVFDLNGISIVANPALSRLLGIPDQQLIGVSMEMILQAGNVSPQERGAILSMLTSPGREIPNVRFRWSDTTLLVNAAQVMSGFGNPIGMVAVFRDFTREAEVEQMKNTFVAMVSHELRTPLNAIIGYAEMIREAVYGPIAPRQAGIMERIENSSKRLLSLVSDLLDQAQIEAGRMKIHIAKFNVPALLDVLHALMDKQVAEKGLTLTTHMEPDAPLMVSGDVNRLQQVLLNLVGNALKFTTTGGIDVRVYRMDQDHWGFDVADTGPGIPAEAQEYVFESFRQVEGVTTREHGGIGLGLAIVKNLVELMGGRVSLISEVGRGTTFTVSLPCELPEEKKND